MSTAFLKWAGGKAKLAPAIVEFLPRKIETYYESFLGGGAVFWHLAAQKRFRWAVLNDSNREIIDCYKIVRDFPDDLVEKLRIMELAYNKAPQETFNSWKALNPADLDPLSRAGRTILLNKTGFNGLFRINRLGTFNVPWGKKPHCRIYNENNIRACSEVLNQGVSLISKDFTEVVGEHAENDAVYLDPPYAPTSKTSNFTSYTSTRFTVADQTRLAGHFKELTQKGFRVILSNSDTPKIRALYDGYELNEIQSPRVINSKGEKRGLVGELVIASRLACKSIFT